MTLTVQQAGRLGGKAGTGKAKARTKEQARAAARARWDLARRVWESERANGKLGGRPRNGKV